MYEYEGEARSERMKPKILKFSKRLTKNCCLCRHRALLFPGN